MINYEDFSKHSADPLYVHPTTFSHMRKNNLIDFQEVGNITFPLLKNRVIIVETDCPVFHEAMTAKHIAIYSAVRQLMNPSSKVNAYIDAKKAQKEAWLAKPWPYRIRYRLNVLRLQFIPRFILALENFLYSKTSWIGRGL